MGAVYLAHHEALGDKKVAVKEMELTGYSSEELAQAVKQFNREASFLANLDHPNLVPVTDFFVEEDKHYLVMAYVQGQTLQQLLKKHEQAFDWPQVKQWAGPLADVLAYLHRQNPPILFRDLKPSNIMVEDNGRLRLIDFGIARAALPGDRTSTFLQGMGTSGFSPIEQYGGLQSTDQRSDIYALGATLYYLCTGRVPPDAVARISGNMALTPPTHLVPTLPAKLDALLAKAMADKQHDRHQSMAEFKREMMAIETVLEQEDATEDLGPLPPIGAKTETWDTQLKSPSSIVVEMYPTGATKAGITSSYTGWVGALAALALVTVAVFALSGPEEKKGSPDAMVTPAEISRGLQSKTTLGEKEPEPLANGPGREKDEFEEIRTVSVKQPPVRRPDFVEVPAVRSTQPAVAPAKTVSRSKPQPAVRLEGPDKYSSSTAYPQAKAPEPAVSVAKPESPRISVTEETPTPVSTPGPESTASESRPLPPPHLPGGHPPPPPPGAHRPPPHMRPPHGGPGAHPPDSRKGAKNSIY